MSNHYGIHLELNTELWVNYSSVNLKKKKTSHTHTQTREGDMKNIKQLVVSFSRMGLKYEIGIFLQIRMTTLQFFFTCGPEKSQLSVHLD